MPMITGFFAKTFKGHSFKQPLKEHLKDISQKFQWLLGFLQKPLKDIPLNNL